jgi:hypothetical protein
MATSSGCFRTDECRPLAPAPQRRRDTDHRLTHDIDVWVASASADGAPYLVPLSFDWDGEALERGLRCPKLVCPPCLMIRCFG